VVLLAFALIAGCGNRVDHERVVAVGNGYGPVDAAAQGAVPIAPGTTDGAGAPGVGSPGVVAPAGAAPGAAVAQPSAVPSAAVSGKPAAKPGAGAQVPTESQPCAQSLSPIRLGQTLATSGLVGAAIAGLRNGVAVWARDVNARGGVQCHPIELTQLDDGSDPARVSANWNTLVHQKGVVALVGTGTPIAIAALRAAAERDKVPVVGADLNAEDYFQSPYLFPQGGLPLTAYDGSYILAAKAAGGGKSGLIYCVEASICTGVKNNHAKATQRAGLTPGPVVAGSLTQPDFSSECQTMKQAGVTVLFLALDGSGSVRAARSCAGIGFKPAIATSAIAVSAQAAADPTLRQFGTYLGTNNVPFIADDSPAAAAFRDAMKRYAPSAALEEQALLGWAAGKLFETALAKVADKARAGDVTTQMVLDGLWQLKNEKLGGLGPGVTFTQGKAATGSDCFYGLRLGTDGYSAPLGAKPTCFGADGGKDQSSSDPSMATTSLAPAAALAVQRTRTQRGRRKD
jgi:branched-chain amino acid transport system substrate-binding protein